MMYIIKQRRKERELAFEAFTKSYTNRLVGETLAKLQARGFALRIMLF